MNTTPRYIITVVITTLAVLSAVYVCTLAWCVVRGLSPSETLGSFSHVGDTIIGAFTGALINTRSGPSEPVKESTTTTTTQESNPTEKP